MRRTLSATLALLALATLLPASAWSAGFLVQLQGQIPADLGAQVSAAGGTLVRTLPEIGYAVATSDDPAFATRLGAQPGVLAVTRDVTLRWTPDPATLGAPVEAAEPATPAVDPTTAAFFACQWNMRNIDAPGAWALGAFGDPDVKVAVLDTGVDPTHNDLVGRVDTAESTSALTPGSSPCGAVDEGTFLDFGFHGTFVSSNITSNGLGIAAVAPDTRVVAVKVLNCAGSGRFSDIISGLLYAASLPDVDVINMSLGVPGGIPKDLPGAGPLVGALNQTVNFVESRGKLVVSASGNDGLDMDHSGDVVFVPAESGSGIAVYATAWNDALASYSNFGVSGTWVGAPGGDGPDPDPPLPGCVVAPSRQGLVFGACSTFASFGCGPNSYLIGAGTSFATPIVSGVAALIDGQAGGGLNGQQLKARLAESADDLGAIGVDLFFSHGRVNARKAVE